MCDLETNFVLSKKMELYVKEGRQALLPSADALAFSLHYS
jgi:hypothetical protein